MFAWQACGKQKKQVQLVRRSARSVAVQTMHKQACSKQGWQNHSDFAGSLQYSRSGQLCNRHQTAHAMQLLFVTFSNVHSSCGLNVARSWW